MAKSKKTTPTSVATKASKSKSINSYKNKQGITKLESNFEQSEVYTKISNFIFELDTTPLLEFIALDLSYYNSLQEEFYKQFELALNKENAISKIIQQIKAANFDFAFPELKGNHNYYYWRQLTHDCFNVLLSGENFLLRDLRFKCEEHLVQANELQYPINPIVENFPELKEFESFHPRSLDVYWLEALVYIKRAGNYAHYCMFLENALQKYTAGTFLVPTTELKVGLGEINQRILFLDRLGILDVIENQMRDEINSSKKFARLIAHILAVKVSSIEKQLRIATYPPGKEPYNKNNHRKVPHYEWLLKVAKQDLKLSQSVIDRLQSEMEQIMIRDNKNR
jgi:hypothetical protein